MLRLRRIYSLLTLGLLLGGAVSCYQRSTERLRGSVYKLYVNAQGANYREPWRLSSISKEGGTGFYIGSNRILTNAHVVANGKTIFVQREGSHHLEKAFVEFIAHDVDLALLSVKNPNYFEGVHALEFNEEIRVGDKVSMFGFPIGGEEISVTTGVLSRIGYRGYNQSGLKSHLSFQTDAAMNPGNSGGPVFHKGKVIGIAFQVRVFHQNLGYIIPALVAQRFLSDIEDGVYDAHPFLGVSTSRWTMGVPSFQKFYGFIREQGVLINYVEKTSPAFGLLEVGDILLEIDKHPIGVDGKILFLSERVDYKTIYDLKQNGGSVSFIVLRNREVKSIEIPIKSSPRAFSSFKYERNPRYVNYGGAIFTPLTTDWLRMEGSDWLKVNDPDLLYLFEYSHRDPYFEEIEEFVVLSEILTKDYLPKNEHFKHGVVHKFNQKKVRSFSHFVSLVDKEEKEQAVIKFYNRRELMFFNLKRLKKATADTLLIFGMRADREMVVGRDASASREDI